MGQPHATRPHSRLQGLIIGLQFVVLLGTLALIALLVTRPPSQVAEVDSQACQAFIDATEAEAETACDELRRLDQAAKHKTVPAGGNQIGFDYPVGWSVTSTFSRAERVTWRASLVPEYFFFCEGCDGPFIDISMQVGSLTDPAIVAQPNFHDYLLTVYSAANGFSEVAIQDATDDDRYHVTGKLDGLYTGRFESIYYTGSANWASVVYVDRNPAETTTNDGWEIVKESLDFSSIN